MRCVIAIVLAGWLLATAGHVQAAVAAGAGQTFAPRYIVLATDVSGSMNWNDPPFLNAEGKPQALRDDGQVTFLTLLPLLYPNNFIGVVQFTDSVTYCQPGEPGKAIRAGEEPLKPWNKTDLRSSELQDLVRSVAVIPDRGTSIELALDWALEHIGEARKRHGNGSGLVILLSDGDPDHATEEVAGTRTATTAAARRLAAADISVCPVIINTASHRQGHNATASLPGKEKAAEQLMERVASMTKGKAYRIKPDFDFVDIFADVLGMFGNQSQVLSGAKGAPVMLPIAEHHRTVVLISSALDSIQISPLEGANNRKPYLLPLSSAKDEESSIVCNVVPLTTWQIITLRRPAQLDRVTRYWAGHWSLVPRDKAVPYRGRAYLIPDFLLQLSTDPDSPCYPYEQVSLKAFRKARPQEPFEAGHDVPKLVGGDLTLRFQIMPVAGGNPLDLGQARSLDARGDVFTADLRLVDALAKPGRYQILCHAADRVGDQIVPLGVFQSEFVVQSCPVMVKLKKLAADGRTYTDLMDLRADAMKEVDSCRGGDQVRAQIISALQPDEISSAILYTNATPNGIRFTARADAGGQLATDVFTLPDNDIEISGHAEVTLNAPAASRVIRFRDFRLRYGQPPLQVKPDYSEWRTPLWPGEVREAPVSIRIFPRSRDLADAVAQALPDLLSHAVMRVQSDEQDPNPKSLQLKVERDKSQQVKVQKMTDSNLYEVVATYRITATDEIPDTAKRCTLDLGTIRAAGEEKRIESRGDFTVEELPFAWYALQKPIPANRTGLAPVLHPEDVYCSASWKPDLPVSGIRFKFMAEDGKRPLAEANLAVQPGSTRAENVVSLRGIQRGQKGQLWIVVSLQGAQNQFQEVKRITAGSFEVKDRLPEVTELSAGLAAGVDLVGWAFEQPDLQVRATLSGFDLNQIAHRAILQDFENSCVLAMDSNSAPNLPIAWDPKVKELTGDAYSPGSYEVVGSVDFTPSRQGYYKLSPVGQYMSEGQPVGVRSRTTLLNVKPPRFVMQIREAGTDDVLFDSQAWAGGAQGHSIEHRSLPTKLIVRFWQSGGVSQLIAAPWKLRLAIEHQPAEDSLFAATGPPEIIELPEGAEKTSEFPIVKTGSYRLVCSAVREGNHPGISLATPTLLRYTPLSITRVLPPPNRITAATRHWPFRYTVPEGLLTSGLLRFEYRFAGAKGEATEWIAGRTAPADQAKLIPLQDSTLPVLKNLAGGKVEFRLRNDPAKEPLISWTSDHVMLVNPALNGLSLLDRASGGAKELTRTRSVHPPTSVVARVNFNRVQELENWWTRKRVTVYVLHNPHGDVPSAGPASVDFLDSLVRQDQAQPEHDPKRAAIYRFTQNDDDFEVPIFEAQDPPRILGPLRRAQAHRYVVIAAADYAPRDQTGQPSPGAEPVREWSDIQSVVLNVPWQVPFVWWAGGGVAVVLFPVLPLWLLLVRMLVQDPAISPGPSGSVGPKLSADDGAVQSRRRYVRRLRQTTGNPRFKFSNQPAGEFTTSPVNQTPLKEVLRLHREYLRSSGRSGASMILTTLSIIMRRLWFKDAVIGIEPKAAQGPRRPVLGLIRISTHLGRRNGRAWIASDKVETFALPHSSVIEVRLLNNKDAPASAPKHLDAPPGTSTTAMFKIEAIAEPLAAGAAQPTHGKATPSPTGSR